MVEPLTLSYSFDSLERRASSSFSVMVESISLAIALLSTSAMVMMVVVVVVVVVVAVIVRVEDVDRSDEIITLPGRDLLSSFQVVVKSGDGKRQEKESRGFVTWFVQNNSCRSTRGEEVTEAQS